MNNNPPFNSRHPTPPPSPPPPPPPIQTQPHHSPNDVVPSPTPVAFASSSSTSFNISDSSALQQQQPQQQNPRKKRSKLTRPDADDNPENKRPRPAKKPDPTAPKITTPCSECGRKFWSWKALFGHMRCHPERHWRGIQPPPDFQRTDSPSSSSPVQCFPEIETSMSEDDHDAASSLLILAGGTDQTTQLLPGTSGCRENDSGGCRFECSSCKKVFGSHQALGGHRASHKNVKGCFANTKSDMDADEEHHEHSNVAVVASRSYGVDDSNADDVTESGHQCSICWRVFSSGQALGGHKRCHWEKAEEGSVVMTQVGMSSNVNNSGGLDLNLPASAAASAAAAAASAPASEDDQCSSYSSAGLGLDLRLGL
ncbi:zinc finger protein ZAT3 [Argentina anserina]|uniref:zinc finger protein ZAT3 n=1 Tax=Argentina anserina TaxID=57926 RepID=UPI002176483D|nr:zinc finger protein ZAT3 [Potentilla anserina]